MPTWGVVTTVKAPEEHVLAFIAHHLSLGASCVWVYFDNPDDPAYQRVSTLAKVKAVRCTDWYWILRGGRHVRITRRQISNCRDARRVSNLDWLCHIDVDEFLFAPEPIADILASVPADVLGLVMEPFEALHDPDAPDDIFTSRHFRGPVHGTHRSLQPAIFGESAPLLLKGTLGHGLGKSFSRAKVRGLVPGLHFPLLKGKAVRLPFHPALRVLHFHAHDPVAWRQTLPFRLGRGGVYNCAPEKVMWSYLTKASDDEIDRFYKDAMGIRSETIALLQANDRLITTDLGLKHKVAALLAGRL